MKIKEHGSYAVILIFFIIILGVIIRLIKFSNQPFYDWDESLYAQIAREVLINKSINTTFNKNPWLDKPPLSYLMIAGVFFGFGENETIARSLFAVFGIVVLVLLYKLTKLVLSHLTKTENKIVFITPVLITASTPLFLDKATTLNTDILVSTSILGYFLYYKNNLIKTLFLLLGVWSKSVIGFFPLIIEPVLILKDFKDKKKLLAKTGLLLFQILLGSLWYFYAYAEYGDYFIKSHFFAQIYKRLILPIELHFGNKWFYFIALYQNFKLLSVFISAGLMLIAADFSLKLYKQKSAILQDKNTIFYFILLSPILLLFIYTVAKTKLDWYLIYLIPLLSISVAFLLEKLNNSAKLISLIIIFAYSLFGFVNQTFLLTPKISVNEKIIMAECLNKSAIVDLAVLTDNEQRKIKNVLEAAKLQTESSFFYAGSPSFIYYLNKPVTNFYNINEFLKNYSKYNAVAISNTDFQSLKNELDLNNYSKICQTKNWIGLKALN